MNILKATLFLLASSGPAFAYSPFVDPINAPATSVENPQTQPALALATVGSHLVAVGPRGLIIVSSVNASHWTQARVPVQSDLVAVQLIDQRNGWACGHDGVILHTQDGGLSWVTQLNGISARQEFEKYYGQRIAAGDSSVSADLQQIQMNFDNGATLPWMGVWFTSPNIGYAVGPFGNLAMTHDGGSSWQPWLEHIDNSNFYDLNAIAAVGKDIYIVGEQGSVFLLDQGQQKFVSRPTGYAGSLFGVIGNGNTVIVFGLGGVIYRSLDKGKTWTQSNNLSTGSIMNGEGLPDGQFLLVTVGGDILVSNNDGKSFVTSPARQSMPLTDVSYIGNGNLILSGLGGVTYASMNTLLDKR